MSQDTLHTVVFYLLGALTLAGAAGVAFARNIVRSAFSLLATFLGVAGLYGLLSADLVAVIQVLVYVGGVLVLFLFAVMLTSRISDVRVSNPSLGVIGGILVLAVIGGAGGMIAFGHDWPTGSPPGASQPTSEAIGDALLGPYVLPFEVVSMLLLAALIGAVTLAAAPRRGEGAGRPAAPVAAAPTAVAPADGAAGASADVKEAGPAAAEPEPEPLPPQPEAPR